MSFFVQLTCCGRLDGFWGPVDDWSEADKFRESYLSGPGVKDSPYSSGHDRSAIIVDRIYPKVPA